MLTLSYEAGYLEMGLSQERSKSGGALSGDNDDDNNDVDNGINITINIFSRTNFINSSSNNIQFRKIIF